MAQLLVDSLNQVLEFRSFKVFYQLRDGAQAEEILNALDRCATPSYTLFGHSCEYPIEVYLYPTQKDWDRTGERPLATQEYFRLLHEHGAMLSCSEKQPEQLAYEAAYGFNSILFNNLVHERQIGPWLSRSPSWLQEGVCSLCPMAVRGDRDEYLKKGWALLQENEKAGQLIQPPVMMKYIGLIPNRERKVLAYHQAYFMVKYLQSLYPDRFVAKYATLMSTLEDMSGEDAFKQITTYTFDKFFNLFRDWVRTTNAWSAIAD